MKLAEARKALVAVAGAAAEVVSLGLLHGTTLQVVTGVLSVLTAAGVYTTPNVKPGG